MSYLVIGGGLAGGTAVTELREQGYDGPVALYAAEPHLPYERPPLSKGYLLGNDPIDSAFVHDQAWYDEHRVELRLADPVLGVDTAARVIRTATGERPYEKLLIATGAFPRHLPLADESGAPVAYLRTIEDSDRLKAAFRPGARVVIVGGGWIGLEAASAARQADADVTLFETADLPLLGVLGPDVARVFADLHRSHGVDLRLGTSVGPADLDGDVVLVGIGAVPDTHLAEAAGLDVDNGVLVDERLRTSAPDVYAVGDVANHQHPVLGRRIRVEHWDTAIHQAKTAARNLLGADESYERLPYFFTDQYDLGMEYVGSGSGHDDVVIQGDTHEAFRAYWLRDGVVTAAMHVNDWDSIDELREAIGKPF